ncbi:MAG TPA: ATP-binding protein [Pyrinomonadaceae bacterium]|nr:ATP-binding protein [Pyrinomonadaceae bacterium]
MILGPKPRITTDSLDGVRAAAERLKRENDELRQLNAVLSRSNQDLERFAFAASHDLQEPLRAIIVYAELLAQKCRRELDGDCAIFANHVVEGSKRMRALLADLLAYAEIGAVPDESVELVDLNIAVEKVKKNLQMSIDENRALVVSAELPTLSAAHEFHFVQLFQNLVGNAIKYRGEASPLIRISVHRAGGTLEFHVTDNGLGVAPENHQKIFEAFKRLHDNRSPGTGIGLAICQRVVEKYGGRIWVDSQAGQGATFRFTLPNVKVCARKPPAAALGARKVRIVLIDDNPADVCLLRLALEKADLNYELTVIDDGAEALAFVRQQGKYASSETPDLAVLDVNLPKNDGLEVLEAMSRNRAFSAVPAVILSCDLSPYDLGRIQECELAHYIAKPSTLEEFLNIGLVLKSLLYCQPAGRSAGGLA